MSESECDRREESGKVLAAEYGVGRSTICDIKKEKPKIDRIYGYITANLEHKLHPPIKVPFTSVYKDR